MVPGTRRLLVMVGALGISACGGGSSSPPTTPTPPTSQPTMTIGSNGLLSPKELVVSPGTRVLFTNNSGRARQVSSDPHPEHTDCPAINQVGFLAPGQTRETGNLNVPRTCGVHDHDDPTNTNVQGRIVIR